MAQIDILINQVQTLNQTVAKGYLYIFTTGIIKLVNIKEYLIYLNVAEYQRGYQWIYDRALNDVKLWTLEEVRLNPSILEDPIEEARPGGTSDLPKETKTTVSTDLSGITVNWQKVIPYIIGFILLSVLFLAITNKASE